MTPLMARAQATAIAFSPLYVRAERLRVATALRREQLPRDHLRSCWRGIGVYAAVALAEDSRFYPGRTPAPRTVRVALRVLATLAQAGVTLGVAPYCAALVGLAYLRHGEKQALDVAATHFVPLYVGLHASNLVWWVLLMATAGYFVRHGITLASP